MSRLSELSIKSLHGVGPARAAAYSRVGVETVEDLLMYFPRAYENRGDIKLLAQSEENIKNAVILTVATEPKVARIRRGMNLLKFRAFDESGSCQITFFNQDYLKNQFPIVFSCSTGLSKYFLILVRLKIAFIIITFFLKA